MKTFDFSEHSDLKHLVLKEDSITIYYKGFDELLRIMDMSENIHQNLEHPFTFVLDHESKETEKAHYHDEIDENFTDEGHYHFEKKDKSPISEKDLISLFNSLKQYSLITQSERKSLQAFFSDVPEKRSLNSTIFFSEENLNPSKKKIKSNVQHDSATAQKPNDPKT